jgi:large subunit ribosomal protein L21
MKQAVIKTSGQQFLVHEGMTLNVDLISNIKQGDKIEFTKLAIIDGDNSEFGTPELDSKVKAEVVEPIFKGQKLKIMKFKAKKRVRKLTGHRQKYTTVKIEKI